MPFYNRAIIPFPHAHQKKTNVGALLRPWHARTPDGTTINYERRRLLARSRPAMTGEDAQKTWSRVITLPIWRRYLSAQGRRPDVGSSLGRRRRRRPGFAPALARLPHGLIPTVCWATHRRQSVYQNAGLQAHLPGWQMELQGPPLAPSSQITRSL